MMIGRGIVPPSVMKTWLPIVQGPDEQKLIAYRDGATREKLRAEVDAPLTPESTFSKRSPAA
jgi:hypothetical protein